MDAKFTSDGIIPISISQNTPRSAIWEWLLLPFIVGLMTLSNIEGWSKIVILWGSIFAWLFLIYFLILKLKMQPEVIVYLAWILWSLTGILKATEMNLYVQNLMTIIQMGVLIFLVAGITALRRNISIIMLAIAVGGIIVALSSYYTGELWLAKAIEMRLQAEGLTGNPNSFAYHLLFVVFAMFYFLGSNRSRWQYIFIVMIIAIAVFGIIYSASRKGFLGIFAFVLLWFYFYRSKKLTKDPIKSLISLAILLGIIYFAANYVVSNTFMGKRFNDLSEYGRGTKIDYGTKERIELYQEGLDIIKKNPFLGIGLNQFIVSSSLGLYSHSDYIEVAANTGLVGFILYFAIYIILWLRLNRLEKMSDDSHLLYTIGLLKAMIITILLLAFGRPNITSKLTWIFLASAIGYTWSIERALKRALLLQYKNKGSFPVSNSITEKK